MVYEYWQDSVHLETMISSNYRDIGAGVAQAGGKVYYTIDVGYIAGGAGNSPPPAGTPPPTSIPVMSIRVATPRADGSIIHMVESGQFLINIAKAYEIPLPDLLSINGLTDQTVIFPGDKLFIQLPWTVAPTSELATLDTPGPGRSARASSGTPRPKQSTQTPTKAKKIITIAPAALAPPVASLPSPQALERSVPEVRQHSTGPDFLLVTMLVLGVTGTALVALGSALKRSA